MSAIMTMVLHLKSSTANYAIYLDYGFMAISEPQKVPSNKKLVMNVISTDSIIPIYVNNKVIETKHFHSC